MAISPPQPPLGALRAAVDDAVARLPGRQRRVLAMVEGEGAPYDQVAARLEIHPAAVAALVARARLGLSAALRGEGPPPLADPVCLRAQTFLAARQDGELPDEARRTWLDEHLATCTTCLAAREAMHEASLAYRAFGGEVGTAVAEPAAPPAPPPPEQPTAELPAVAPPPPDVAPEPVPELDAIPGTDPDCSRARPRRNSGDGPRACSRARPRARRRPGPRTRRPAGPRARRRSRPGPGTGRPPCPRPLARGHPPPPGRRVRRPRRDRRRCRGGGDVAGRRRQQCARAERAGDRRALARAHPGRHRHRPPAPRTPARRRSPPAHAHRDGHDPVRGRRARRDS